MIINPLSGVPTPDLNLTTFTRFYSAVWASGTSLG
jgi:hypothetical protein